MNSVKSGFLKSDYSKAVFFILLVCLVPITIIAGVIFGSADITAAEVLGVTANKLFGIESVSISEARTAIIWDLRIPRILLALAVGGGLAVCGAVMQAVTQNVLAEPYILGVSSGASAMVALAYFVGIHKIEFFSYTGNAVQIFAFVGALISLLLVYGVGATERSGTTNHLILAGMAVSVMLNALTNFLISILPNDSSLKNVINWMWGSLASARWSNIHLPSVVSLIGLIFFLSLSNSYNLISLGRETAVSLGVNTRLVTKVTLFAVAFVTGVFVSYCGLIGFVGFIIPHTVRLLVGSEHKRLLIFTYMLGAVFLGIMDIFSRNLFAPREIAIGIFSAFVGAPFLVFLLTGKSRR